MHDSAYMYLSQYIKCQHESNNTRDLLSGRFRREPEAPRYLSRARPQTVLYLVPVLHVRCSFLLSCSNPSISPFYLLTSLHSISVLNVSLSLSTFRTFCLISYVFSSSRFLLLKLLFLAIASLRLHTKHINIK